MHFENLPTETVTHIFLSLPTVSAAINLSSTCRRFRHIFSSSKKLLILEHAADHEFGPTTDIVQFITQNSSQPPHIYRSVAISDALIRSIVNAGHVARKWEDIYPFKKWRLDFENRRTLTNHERLLLRQAIYRLWLFTRAFHTPDTPRLRRGTMQAKLERAALLHNFTTSELAEMLDVHNILRDVVSRNICPSNSTIRRKFQKRFPESNYQLLFNLQFNFPPPPTTPSSVVPDAYYHSGHWQQDKHYNKYLPTRTHEPGAEGWGDDILHYYVVEDMLKLDPAQMLHLKENAPFKGQVEEYLRDNLGDWFENNGETFVQTLEFVLTQRGEDIEDLKQAIEDGELGVAVVGGGGCGERRDSAHLLNSDCREQY